MFALVEAEVDAVHISDVRGFGYNGEINFLVFQYSVGSLVVFVIYDPKRLERKVIRNSFHPRKHTRTLKFLSKITNKGMGRRKAAPML